MKDIKKYINEALEARDAEVSGQEYKICDALTRHVDYSQLKETNDQDPDRFDISKENEQLFIDSFENANTEYTALSTQAYYELTNAKTKWENLSVKEKADFDTQNGDIIIVDKDNKPVYFIDIKISDNYIGAVSLGSLANFNENGIYICVCKKQKLAKFVSHKALVKAVKEEQKKYLKPVVKGRKEGYPIDWEGQKLTSEYFVPGKEIANFK
jgi:hypothetical protein